MQDWLSGLVGMAGTAYGQTVQSDAQKKAADAQKKAAEAQSQTAMGWQKIALYAGIGLAAVVLVGYMVKRGK